MQASTRAFIKRGGAACAAAAVLLGGSFSVAMAAPSSEPTSVPSITAEATSSAAATGAASATALPDGLAEAVERDLNMSVEEFNAQGELAAAASEAQAAAAKADPNAQVSLAGDTIKVQASPAAAAAKAAAGSAKVSVTSAPAAPLSATVDAANVDALFADYVSEFGTSNLQSVMVNGNGEFVIRTGDPVLGGSALQTRSFMATAKPSVGDFAAKYSNVTVVAASGPVAPFATDVVNGQGYGAFTGDQGAACSIGWNGFNAEGKPAVITAGHCANDGAAHETGLTNPETEPAEGGAGGEVIAPLGLFGASQFGGPDNTPFTIPADWNGDYNKLNNIGTDVAVIDDLYTELNQLAKVTDWTTPADPKDSGRVVGGVSDAIVGTDICKSGRTTGWSCGTVTEVGVFLVQGHNYPADLDDVRAVRGFGSTSLKADQGDSGGSIIAGELAVGMISGGDADTTYGVSLTDALAHTDGYTVKIFLEAPKVTTTAPVYREGAVSGTVAGAPAGTTVVVTIGDVKTEVAVDKDGKWTAKAPNKFGPFTVTAQAKNGFSTSATTEASFEVIKKTLPAPAITTPANNANVAAPVTTITGTGKAGATVTLTGGVTGTSVVGTDSKWSFTVEPGLEIGAYTVTAKQTLTDWNDSTTVTNTFDVKLAAPTATSPTNGQEFAFNEGPTVISGTNEEGASVQVTINGTVHDAVVVDGTWSVTLDAKATTGKYTVTAVQTVGDDVSLTSTSAFTVLAEPKPEPTTPPATQKPAPTTAPAPAPTTAPAKAPSNGDLANTGASSSMLVLGGAGGLLLLAGSAFLLIRRRNNAA